jgi:hypothetical protein
VAWFESGAPALLWALTADELDAGKKTKSLRKSLDVDSGRVQSPEFPNDWHVIGVPIARTDWWACTLHVQPCINTIDARNSHPPISSHRKINIDSYNLK